MPVDPSRRFRLMLLAASAVALGACSGASEEEKAAETTAAETTTAETTTTETAAAPADATGQTTAAPAAAPAAPAATAAAAKPTADSTDTLGGEEFASFTGVAKSGATVFLQCKSCHVVDAGVNRIGPSLAGIVGRAAGTIPGYNYTPANKNSGITWSEAKLFQYLERPQRVIPGTKMAFAGIKDPQKRADVIAYLKAPT